MKLFNVFVTLSLFVLSLSFTSCDNEENGKSSRKPTFFVDGIGYVQESPIYGNDMKFYAFSHFKDDRHLWFEGNVFSIDDDGPWGFRLGFSLYPEEIWLGEDLNLYYIDLGLGINSEYEYVSGRAYVSSIDKNRIVIKFDQYCVEKNNYSRVLDGELSFTKDYLYDSNGGPDLETLTNHDNTQLIGTWESVEDYSDFYNKMTFTKDGRWLTDHDDFVGGGPGHYVVYSDWLVVPHQSYGHKFKVIGGNILEIYWPYGSGSKNVYKKIQ